MIKESDNLITKVISHGVKKKLTSGKIGLEKESLRIFQSKISSQPHHDSLGSALCNKWITTDFSEAQLEFITPAVSNKQVELDFLDNLHHFVTQNIGDEYLWPFSMPPFIQSDTEIPIASYGCSNLALFKMTYRNGLSHRYGRTMQAISGIHFNYSFPEHIWETLPFIQEKTDSKELRSKIYFRTLRNLHRFNWLILYLFGASPVATKNFFDINQHDLQKLDKHSYYLPYATSLRMSDLGYQNINQSNLSISLNSIEEYTFDLKKATEKKCEDFQKIDKLTKEDYPQINSNILQIEDEYYSVSRPKSSIVSNERLTAKLNSRGVDYIELRSLDLNPFQRIGIDLDTLNFLELFLIYCSFSSSQLISEDDMQEIKQNDLSVSLRGREPGLILQNNRRKISLENWANEILDGMMLIAESLDNKNSIYKSTIQKFSAQIMDQELTLSAMILNKMMTEKLSFDDLGRIMGQDYKNQYKKMETSHNSDWDLLEKESLDSKKRQDQLEETNNESFEYFVKKYFNQSL